MIAKSTEPFLLDFPSISIVHREKHALVAIMNIEDWLKVSNYPYQPTQYTDKQSTALHWKRLMETPEVSSGPLKTVIAAAFGDKLFKIDGHTRSELWKSGQLPMPNTIIAIIYQIVSHDQFTTLYNTIHAGTRHFYENVITAYEEAGIQVRSNRLKHGFIVEAMNIAVRGTTRQFQDKRVLRDELRMREAVAAFKTEIEVIDSIDPRPDVFVTGVLAAALLMLALDPKRITFFEKLGKGHGNTRNGQRDPVEATLRYLDLARTKKGNQGKLQSDICERTVRAVLAWEAGEDDPAYWVKQTIRGVPLAPHIRELRRIKKIR